jgi:general secretion pathway protein D
MMTTQQTSLNAATQLITVATLLVSLFPSAKLVAQQSETGSSASDKKGMIQLTLPPDTELKTLIDLVSQRLGVQFLYDEQVANKRISINSPKPIPADSLLDVLRSALKMKGLALIDGDVPGWKRIVPAEDLPQIATTPTGPLLDSTPGTVAVTQTFALVHLTSDRVGKIIEPFLTKKGANTVTLADKNLLIVTDYAPNLRRIARLIELIDQAGPDRMLKFQKIVNIDAGDLSQQIMQALAARSTGQTVGVPQVNVSADKRTNQLLVVGTKAQLEEVSQLVCAFDVPLQQRTHVYSFHNVDAERIDRLVKETVDPITAGHLYHSAIDRSDNLLVATCPEQVHSRILELKREMDVESHRAGSGVHFYRLKYADAQDVLNTLRAIDQRSTGGSGTSQNSAGPSIGRGGVGSPQNGAPQDGPFGNSQGGQNTTNQPGNAPPSPGLTGMQGTPPQTMPVALAGMQSPPGMGTIVPGSARVSIDTKSNSIIVIADRAVQQMYEQLIQTLDRRQPQVMIEARIVILDTTNDYSLGVEVSAGVSHGAAQILQFTSFGLSSVTAATGALAINPAQGFNWALVDPSAANAVIQAMANHTRSKVLSAPRIVVADNSPGNLASVQEVPYTSVNASTTVATTSFAGFAEAGTTIQVTPRIMDDDHLSLQFNVTLNSFTGTGSNGVPPPRQTNQISSKVTVPDGYTLIVGGLTNKNNSVTRNGVPILENIPILRDLTSLQTSTNDQTTLFVFLRPTILKDDKFRDLKYLSDRDLRCAAEPGNFPDSCPLLIK